MRDYDARKTLVYEECIIDIWNCIQTLCVLGKSIQVTIWWVPAYEDIENLEEGYKVLGRIIDSRKNVDSRRI